MGLCACPGRLEGVERKLQSTAARRLQKPPQKRLGCNFCTTPNEDRGMPKAEMKG